MIEAKKGWGRDHHVHFRAWGAHRFWLYPEAPEAPQLPAHELLVAGDEPQKPAELKPSTRRFQRLRWEKLEHHWQLCGEPWPELAARGWA